MKTGNLIKMTLLVSMLALAAVPTTAENYKVGNNELLDALNVAIGEIVSSGEYDTIYSKWFSGEVVLTDDTDSSTATTYPELPSEGTLYDIVTRGEIVFGSDTSYPPFEFLEGNDVVGFDADIADAIAAKLSAQYGKTITAKMQTNNWDSIIPDLQTGKFDAILSAMTKTEERAQEVQFTRAYYTSKQGILAGPNSPSITGIEDLNKAGITVGVQSGTTSDIYAAANLGNADVKGYDTIDLAIAALDNGDVDFVLGDLPTLAYYSVDNPSKGMKVVGSFGDDELFGIAVRYNEGEKPGDTSDKATEKGTPVDVLSLVFSMSFIALVVKLRRYKR